jgi:hypothetical protein
MIELMRETEVIKSGKKVFCLILKEKRTTCIKSEGVFTCMYYKYDHLPFLT